MSDQEVIETYKAQASVETGFRFLKDPLFFTSSLFLKKPERLKALLMVMTLALLIYAIAQKRLRDALTDENETIPNQIGKPVQKPTMRWVFQCFEGIDMLSIGGDVTIHGLNELRKRILKTMGTKMSSEFIEFLQHRPAQCRLTSRLCNFYTLTQKLFNINY